MGPDWQKNWEQNNRVLKERAVALLGGMLISTLLPLLLLLVREVPSTTVTPLEFLNVLAVGEIIFCAFYIPVAWVLGSRFWRQGAELALGETATRNRVVQHGVTGGLCCMIFNPGVYFAAYLLSEASVIGFANACGIMAAGGLFGGFWAGWQMWRLREPSLPRWPQYSLQELLAGVVLIGVMFLLVFKS